MNFSLTPELESFIEKNVRSGLYKSASEVIRAGLRLLKEKEELRLPELPATQGELEDELLASIDRLKRDKGIDGKESLRRFRKRVKDLGLDA